MDCVSHCTLRVVDIAKMDAIGWASSLTRCLDVAILDLATFDLRHLFCCVDSLAAEVALLHHATGSDRHFWIEAHGQIVFDVVTSGLRTFWIHEVRDPILSIEAVFKPVVTSHLVSAVVGAVAGTHTTVVDLLIDALIIMH